MRPHDGKWFVEGIRIPFHSGAHVVLAGCASTGVHFQAMGAAPLPPHVQFSGHETFPLRQLWLRKAYVAVQRTRGAAGAPVSTKAVFAPEVAIREFGVGKNMVAAIRHWSLACDVLQEDDGLLSVGAIGDALLSENKGFDPYFEKPATAWLVHWLLAGRALRTTTWWWVFNRVSAQVFDADSVAEALYTAAQQNGIRVSQTTLKRDVEVCLRCYLSRRDGREADDAAEPLLAELGLVSELHAGSFQFRRGVQPSLPDGIFAYALLEFWDAKNSAIGSQQATLSFETIAHEYGAPGQVFKLDERSVSERLTSLEETTNGQLRWSDTAGIRQISRKPKTSDANLKQQVLRYAFGK